MHLEGDEVIARKVMEQVLTIVQNFNMATRIDACTRITPTGGELIWSPLEQGFLKINCDAAVESSRGCVLDRNPVS